MALQAEDQIFWQIACPLCITSGEWYFIFYINHLA